ncbi:hypothetical protein L2E82_27587 [Cichorium intybus]|uniref:Uncharacterized protein n=1 Tax=Cichorium intybus TaxID=13427 RepID=A0ACB9CTI1_CICIN|nr:hypothetical protein L2E82_27587 [Cichorium intybus]
MAGFIFSTNWPTFHQLHQDTAVLPPPPELLSFHDHNFTLSDTCTNPLSLESNHYFSSFNNGVTTTNLSFHNPIRYPNLSSSYNPLITAQQPLSPSPMPLPELNHLRSFTHEYYPYPLIPNYVCPMEQLQTEVPPLPEIYQGGGSDALMAPFQCEEISGVQYVTKKNGNGGGKLSAQSMAARVRRRKISEKTLELGKLVPGGHRMNTAEMFQAAFKYVKFLQAQVGVLQLMGSSPEPSKELNVLVTSRSVQEKLYRAEKCIATRTLGKTLASDHQGSKNNNLNS